MKKEYLYIPVIFLLLIIGSIACEQKTPASDIDEQVEEDTSVNVDENEEDEDMENVIIRPEGD